VAAGRYFLALELVDGWDLEKILQRAYAAGMVWPAALALHVTASVCRALAYAHGKTEDGKPLGIVHRDVSPHNVLVSDQGEVKLTDFGIAKAATHTSLFYKVKGKIGYMSPEQARSEPLDHRSDLYSLAVCMYEILTGERLFVHAGLTTSADEIYSQPVPQLSRKVPGLTTDLDAIMAKALSIAPDQRYQTAGELQEALMRCAHRNGLLMGAPDLAAELREACGAPDQWRGDDEDDDFDFAVRAGTEVYDAADLDEEEDEPSLPVSGPVSIHGLAARAAALRPAETPGARAKSEVDKFAGVELTSIINMMDVEQQGSKPLVDLGAGPPLGAGPSLESEPLAAPPPSRGPPPPLQIRTDTPLPAPRRQVSTGYGRNPETTQRARSRVGSYALRPWMVIGLILLAAGVAAIIVALSGPNLPAGK
jgi:hypothetical protein